MLSLNLIRQNPEKIKQNNRIRKCAVDVDEIIALDDERRKLIAEADVLRALVNEASMGGKPSMAEIERLREVKAKITNYELRITNTENELNILLVQLPNITHESVPVGKDDTENVVYKKWSPSDPEKGSIKKPKFSVKPHYEIGKALDLIDEEKGAKVAGARFWYLKRELVYLEFALLHYAFEFLKKEGFTPVIPPMIVRERALYGTGFFPADEHEIYRLANPESTVEGENAILNVIPSWNDPKQFLIGTAEVPLAAYHADDTLDLSKPLKYCGFSSCFRREAGTYGKDMKGILRGHQFDKIEMFIFASESDSWQVHEYLLSLAEKFWQSFEIPYRVMLMCSGDIGAPNAKKYDIEAWMPVEGKYREIVSASNDTDFQARRLNIKYKDTDGKKQYANTLNSTLIAIGRALIAIIENCQTKEGSVVIPEALKPYMFGLTTIIRKK